MGNKESCGHCEKHCEKWENGAEECHGRVADFTKEIVKGTFVEVHTFGHEIICIRSEDVSQAVRNHCHAVEDDDSTWPCDACETVRRDLMDLLPVLDTSDIESVQYTDGYGARLHAPKYQAHTTWKVFDTEGEAEKHLNELLTRDIFG